MSYFFYIFFAMRCYFVHLFFHLPLFIDELFAAVCMVGAAWAMQLLAWQRLPSHHMPH